MKTLSTTVFYFGEKVGKFLKELSTEETKDN